MAPLKAIPVQTFYWQRAEQPEPSAHSIIWTRWNRVGGGTVASDRCLLAASAQSSRCQPRSAWFFASASIQFRRRVAMKSRIIGAIAGLICVFALVDIFKPATPYVFYNETASAPVGWYRLTPNRALKRDVIVAACPRKRAEHGRHTGSYGPDGEGFGDAPRMDRGQSL